MKIDRFGWIMIVLAVMMAITSLMRAADTSKSKVRELSAAPQTNTLQQETAFMK